jgi:hypothetical protein
VTHHLPLWTLVAVQSFRLPLDIPMHTMAERGVMPEQMTFSGPTGSNFDMLTGLTAVIVAMALGRGTAGNRIVWLWNMVTAALTGHLLIFRALLSK